MVIGSPVAYLHVTILKVAKVGLCKLRSLGNDFSTCIVFHALGNLVLGQLKELVDEDILQVLVLCLILLVNLCKQDLVMLFGLTCLYGTSKEFLVDDYTCQ